MCHSFGFKSFKIYFNFRFPQKTAKKRGICKGDFTLKDRYEKNTYLLIGSSLISGETL